LKNNDKDIVNAIMVRKAGGGGVIPNVRWLIDRPGFFSCMI
jgi:hypothetical protein